MLIVGAGGFAKELIEVLIQVNNDSSLVLYDDLRPDVKGLLWGKYPIIKTESEVRELFQKDNRYTIGIGDPVLRFKMFQKFNALGGTVESVISPLSSIGVNDMTIDKGANILAGTKITVSAHIGLCVLINPNCSISHDNIIGDFVELGPAVNIAGSCSIGNFVRMGINASVIPKINIGNNVIIGAGSVIIQDIPDNSLVVGVPGKVIKKLPPLI